MKSDLPLGGATVLLKIKSFAFCYRECLENIGLVDAGVAEIVTVIDDFFGHDEKTAYVFTSDHGMTNWGKMPSCPRYTVEKL